MKKKTKSIVTNYRIYLVFIPQLRGLYVVDRLRFFAAKIEEVKVKLEERAEELKKDRDVSTIESLINTAAQDLERGLAFAQEAEDQLVHMKVEDVEGAQDLKVEAREKIADARAALRTALQTLGQAWQEIKKLQPVE